jgi:hypothetical protein
MRDEGLEAVYSYVERAYVRLQAGDLMMRCLEEDSLLPIQQFIEGLFLAGPDSLLVMREVVTEAGRRKSQVMDDLQQVLRGIISSLGSYGVNLGQENSAAKIAQLTPADLISILRAQGIYDVNTQVACLRILKESRSILRSLTLRLQFLERLETYLRDWLWGVVYQSIHHHTLLPL